MIKVGNNEKRLEISKDYSTSLYHFFLEFQWKQYPFECSISKEFDNEMHFYFPIFLEINKNKNADLYFFGHLPNDFTKKKMLIESIKYTDITQIIFEIMIPENDKISSKIRNLYAVDTVFSNVNYEYQNLDKGIAQLQQAIYFYMDATESQIFHNRSKFNYPPAMNGQASNSCSTIFSQFSTESNSVHWMLVNFRNEFLKLEVPSLNSLEPPTVSLFLNLDMYIRNRDESTYSSFSQDMHRMLQLEDKNERLLLEIGFTFDGIDANNKVSDVNVILNVLEDAQTNTMFYDSMFLKMIYDDNLLVFLKSIRLVFTPLSFKTTKVELFLSIGNYNFPIRFFIKTVEVPISFFSTLIIGSKPAQSKITNPFMLIVLYDVQIFHGSYFFSNETNQEEIYALSKEELENVFCPNNNHVSRYTGNPHLDLLHYERLSYTKKCTELIFNQNCSIPFCEICKNNMECLLCQPFYKKVSGLCTNINTPHYEYNVFDRVEMADYSIVSKDSVLLSTTNIEKNNSSFIFGRLEWNSFLEANYEALIMKANDTECILFDYRHMDTSILSKYFTNSNINLPYNNRIMVFYDDGNYNFTSNMSFSTLHTISSDHKCTDIYNAFTGFYFFHFCEVQYILDLSMNEYYPWAKYDTLIPKTFNYSFKNTKFNFYLKCQNNCECSLSDNFACEDQCLQSETYKVYNYSPLQDDCKSCPSTCSDCRSDFCTKCHPKNSFFDKKIFDDKTGIFFEDCKACHSSCVEGCMGPNVGDCKSSSIEIEGRNECESQCLECDEKNRCLSCPEYPMNFIYGIDTVGSFFLTKYFYCKKCVDSCIICSGEESCTCWKKNNFAFDYFDKDFNICFYKKCGQNCIKCFEDICTECEAGYKFQNGICVISKNTLHFLKKEDKTFCISQQRYFLNDSFTSKKCSKRFSKCDEINKIKLFNTECINCSLSLFDSKKCVTFSKSNSLPFLNFVFGVINISEQVLKPNLENCLRFKHKNSSFCLECKSTFYLSPSNKCVKCSSNFTNCFNSNLKNSVIGTECADSYFLDTKINKCVKCPDNCQICSNKGCTLCHPYFSLYHHKCFVCSDSNCIQCISNNKCILCKNGFFVNNKTNSCIRCPQNCQICSSSKICLKCNSNYKLNQQSQCQEKCVQGITYFDFQSKKCVPCSKCDDCNSNSKKNCSSCNICQRKCHLEFIRESARVLTLLSDDVVFPGSTDLNVSFFPKSNISIHSFGNKISFVLPLASDFVQAVVHIKNLVFKSCTLNSDISLILSPSEKSLYLNYNDIKNISTALKYSSGIVQSIVLISSIGPDPYFINIIVELLNMNALFIYSTIKSPPQTGLTYYNHLLNILDNFERDDFALFSFNQELAYSVKINEINIKCVPFVAFEIVFCLLAIAIFVFLKKFDKNKDDEKVIELFPLFVKHSLNKKYMKKFFKIYRKKLSTEKMNMIILFLNRAKRKNNTSNVRKKMRHYLRLFSANKYKFLFVCFEINCVHLSHLAVKSARSFLFFEFSFRMFFLSIFYHFIIGFFLFIFFCRIYYLKSFLPFFVKKNKSEYIS